MDPLSGTMRPVAVYYGDRKAYEEILGTPIHWPNNKNSPPSDVPECGFTGNDPKCQEKGS